MRAQIRAAARVLVACVVASALGGVAWGLLAPAEHLLVVGPDRGTSLAGESSHQFDAAAIFVCIGAVVGLLSAVAAWQWRSMRGAVLYAGVLIGSGVGAAAMSVIGMLVARLHYPRADSPQVHQIVALAPGLGTSLVLIVQPLLASLVVLILAAVNPRDDLGAGSVASPPVVERQRTRR